MDVLVDSCQIRDRIGITGRQEAKVRDKQLHLFDGELIPPFGRAGGPKHFLCLERFGEQREGQLTLSAAPGPGFSV